MIIFDLIEVRRRLTSH